MSNNTSLQRINSSFMIVKLMAKEEGASISEMSNETGLDRWAIRKLLANLENLNKGSSKPFSVEICKEDKRKTIYKINMKKLWPAKIEGIDFTDDEVILLAIMNGVLVKNPMLRDCAQSITNKLLAVK